ncbi:HlyD family secretion protein [Thermogemmatispora sp.]|uniref:HlyD family secretion protein n=1 Tax=Thermogemmatispora sp. TaxID=1968838 RepID=UPI001D35D586|nr:HlyD family efflux transporter periplasmic adaptor subunit [Thermogemmatispora sp.]MBX5450743.1 HlyD family secretion protein [Thermogemmatispora sp.]
MRRLILVPVLTVIALFAIVGGIAYWIYYNYMYYSTDDAQVTAPIVTISAPTSGTLTTLSANLGDHVNAGQTLAQVTPVAAATTGTSAATTASTQPAASTTSAARTSAARSLPLTSPISGTVIQVTVVPGQQVTAGSPLLEIYDPSHLTVTAYVDENAINNIQTGQSVDITIDAYKDTKFTGHVKQIVQAAASEFSLLPVQDNASGNFTKVGQRIPVIINLDGSAGKTLMPGMSAEVTIHLH